MLLGCAIAEAKFAFVFFLIGLSVARTPVWGIEDQGIPQEKEEEDSTTNISSPTITIKITGLPKSKLVLSTSTTTPAPTNNATIGATTSLETSITTTQYPDDGLSKSHDDGNITLGASEYGIKAGKGGPSKPETIIASKSGKKSDGKPAARVAYQGPDAYMSESDFKRIFPCTNSPTCQFRGSCGKARLNPLTPLGSQSGYVLNGQDQNYGEWPSYARLSFEAKPGIWMICGGVLISDRHVLTAAHCTFNEDRQQIGPQNYIVSLGDHSVNRHDAQEREYRVSHVCSSRLYDELNKQYGGNIGMTRFDFAVLTLSSKVKFNDHIQPACLPLEPINYDTTKCYLVGAGVSKWMGNKSSMPNTVQKVRMQHMPCTPWGIANNDKSRICFTKHGGLGGSCQGDSGGPILCLDKHKRWTVVSLVSFGSTKCSGAGASGWLGVHTRLRGSIDRLRNECGI